MKTITSISLLTSSLLLGVAGCSTQPTSPPTSPIAQTGNSTVTQSSKPALSDSAALQGTWTGKELTADSDAPCHLIVSGQNFEFRGGDPNEWYKGTFTLRENSNPKVLVGAITDCPVDKYIGKTDLAIYRLENGTLSLTAYEPGNPEAPSTFDAPETRRFTFKLK